MRNERYRSRSRERSQGDRYDYENEQNDRRREQDVQPNSTIMVRNLGLQINENEVRVVTKLSLAPLGSPTTKFPNGTSLDLLISLF